MVYASYSTIYASYSMMHASYSEISVSYSMIYASYSISVSYSMIHASYSMICASYSMISVSYSLIFRSRSLFNYFVSLPHLYLLHHLTATIKTVHCFDFRIVSPNYLQFQARYIISYTPIWHVTYELQKWHSVAKKMVMTSCKSATAVTRGCT